MLNITIVGSGFSGTVVATHLLRALARASAGNGQVKLSVINLVESAGDFGPGTAYSTVREEHLLNVPAGNMSAFPDEPNHFLGWLRTRLPASESGAFVPRALYGRYLRELLADAEAAVPGVLRRWPHRAVRIEPSHSAAGRAGYAVMLSSGETIESSSLVLALGNPPPTPLKLGDSVVTVAQNPWSAAALDGIVGDSDLPVVLIGTGLTMVDVAISLSRLGGGAGSGGAGRFPIIAISRRGLCPQPHRDPSRKPDSRSPVIDLEGWTGCARDVLHRIRESVRRQAAAGVDWREVIASLRPITPQMWQTMPPREQARMLEHLRPFWDAHRHRVAPAAYRQLDELRRSGRLKVMAGRITTPPPLAVTPPPLLAGEVAESSRPEGASQRPHLLHVRPRGTTETITIAAQRIINCTGPATAIDDERQRTLEALFTAGHITRDPHHIGLRADDSGRAIPTSPSAAAHIWLLGPLRRGELWESTAVPELRTQAKAVADAILAAAAEVVVRPTSAHTLSTNQ